MNTLEQLCYLQGVALDYIDYYGQKKQFDFDTRLSVLAACGHPIDNQQQLDSTNLAIDAKPWTELLNGFQTTDETCAQLKVRTATLSDCPLKISIMLESGLVEQVTVDLRECEEVGNYTLDNQRYAEYIIPLPKLAPNYYRVNANYLSQQAKCKLVVAPKTCFSLPHDLKVWGVSCQLYTLRDKRQSGFGDFSSLKELIQLSAQKGADYVLLNPLHKLFMDEPERASPYCPNDRHQINPLYISPRLCVDYSLPNGEYQSNKDVIDYERTVKHKNRCFKVMYVNFCELELVKESDRANDFRRFVKSKAYWQLSQYEYYLQWIAAEQLNYCQRYAKTKGMRIGVILDLAVGCSKDGEEFTRNQQLFVNEASIGAPPDPWAIDGQNWGLAVVDPLKLKQQEYSFFIELLRANMVKGGGLRIDHVMGLLRLWWCIERNENKQGCYVYYPFDSLMAILRLESHLNQCVIIGEDLGVVPPEVDNALADSAIYGNDIFYFEKDHSGAFTKQEYLRENAMLMLANHDVAPFNAWWNNFDLTIRLDYKLYKNEAQYLTDLQNRDADKRALLNWLHENQDVEAANINEFEIYQATMLRLASSNAQFLCLQLDDLSQETLPVNIPGTDKEYPNWRRRLSTSLSTIFSDNPFWEDLNSRRADGRC